MFLLKKEVKKPTIRKIIAKRYSPFKENPKRVNTLKKKRTYRTRRL
jgi:hypothetical protein